MELIDNKKSKYLAELVSYSLGKDEWNNIRVNYNKDDNKQKLYYVTDYHGDHDENWMVLEENGIEKYRINCRYVIEIKWTDRRNF